MEGDKFFLYRFDGDTNVNDENAEVKEFTFSIKTPVFGHVCKAKKTREYNDFYTELRWTLISAFKLRVYYIEKDGVLVHSSFCTPRTFKFPFMKKNDFHIGPCFTDPSFRGRSIYPTVLRHIARLQKQKPKCGDLYMIIEENNTSSREGVKKAGFAEVAELYRKGRLRKYYVKKWL